MSGGAVHIICATLRADADPPAVDHALALARELEHAAGARFTVAGRSPDALATVTWLADREALEPFAASPAHMAFIMRGLAPCISGMWSAAIESDAPPPEAVDAIWVFALPDSDALYEWQVRDLVRSVEALPGVAAAGPTIEERERYRAGGAVSVAQEQLPALRAALETAQRDWGEVAHALAQQTVEVATPAGEATSEATPGMPIARAGEQDDETYDEH